MKNIIKVVHVVPAYPPSLGGMEQRVSELTHKLQAQGIDIEIFTSDLNTTSGTSIEDGMTIHRLKKISFLETPISFVLFFKLLFVKVDIFHIHIAQPFFPVIAAFVAFIRRKPYVVHIRAIVESDNFFGKIFIYCYVNIALRFVFKFATKVIVLTASYVDMMTDKYHVAKDRIIVIPNATNFSIVDAPKKLQSNQMIRLIAVGRVDKQKNYHFMFRVASLLKKQDCNFSLTIVGTGRQEAELKIYAQQLGIADNISWKGRLEGQALEAEYEKADVFIHTALFEGFGTVLIEAMAKGLPICATQAIGVTDVVLQGYNGFLSEFNEEKFTNNILSLINDTEMYQKFSKNNIESIALYKWENITNDTLRVYNSIKS